MTVLRTRAVEILRNAAYSTGELPLDNVLSVATFESDTVLGFLCCYETPSLLLANWANETAAILKRSQLLLRRSNEKAWNVYFVLLAEAPASHGEILALGAIEEDLVGTRKIARAGTAAESDLLWALLPLLPMQHSAQLEAVDMQAEIRLRAQEVPPALVEMFLAKTSDSTLLQSLESEP